MGDVDRNSNVGDNQTSDTVEVVDTNSNYNEDGTEWTRIDITDEFGSIDFKCLMFEDMMKFSFLNIDLGYDFYNAYAAVKGFSIRRHFSGKNSKGELVWKSFVCSKQGLRDKKWEIMSNRKRPPKGRSRCNCKAELRIYLQSTTGRWIVGYFVEVHNHKLLIDYGLIHRSQCKITEAELEEIKSMRKVGIKNPQIYAAIAERVGGYAMVGYSRKSLYNKMHGYGKGKEGDANEALKYMRMLSSTDPGFFWKHLTNCDDRLLHLFWCDSTSRADYEAFGDVLAFDSTYGKNKYKCPVVVFSGVNHHLQTIVFGTAIVSNEEEETYVWLLGQLVEAMNGKTPACVITDGALSMRNAIARVFSQAHHRLCAWHLVKNAGKKVHNPKFLKGFKECMFNDFDTHVFEQRWKLVCDGCGVSNNDWVKIAYAKKEMWATAYMKGRFFADLRTTSRCEALHSQMRKYVGSRQSLCEFIEQTERCWELMRYNELRADFKTLDSETPFITPFKLLEKSAAGIYTREVFEIVQRLLFISAEYKVRDWRETLNKDVVFVVFKYPKEIGRWVVLYKCSGSQFLCECKRMESFGLPCVHILSVIYHMNLTELPESVVLPHWTMKEKEFVGARIRSVVDGGPSAVVSRYTSLVMLCRRMCALASVSLEKYHGIRDKVFVELSKLERDEEEGGSSGVGRGVGHSSDVNEPKSASEKHCSQCRARGHNVRSCPVVKGVRESEDVCANGGHSLDDDSNEESRFDSSSDESEESDDHAESDDYDDDNVDEEGDFDDDDEYDAIQEMLEVDDEEDGD